MKVKEILIWLGIFVIGSLIVSFLLSPGTFKFVSEAKGDIVNSINNQEIDNKVTALNYTGYSCSAAKGIISGSQASFGRYAAENCNYMCEKNNKTYNSYKCIDDNLVCYCK